MLKTTSKRVIQKAAETTGNFIGNKIADKNAQQTNSETVKISIIKKYLKKNIYLQKKDRKLLMI